MSIPDYISPVVAYRVWQWDDAGIRSLNGERWHPGKPLAAGCKAASRHAEVVRGTHDTPQADCTCGVYATKSFDHLHRTGYDLRGICGAVWLWGTVVEHKFGWRAQFAYPKSFCLTSGTLPFTLVAIQSRLETLIPYSTDIFVASPAGNLPLWTRGSGYEQAGLPRRGEETGIRASVANPETGRPRGGHWSWDRHREDDLRGAGLRCAFQPDGSGGLGDVTTISVRDRNTGKVDSETFFGDSPFGK